MQKDLYQNHYDLDTVRKMGRLFGEMNYHFFTGKNHIESEELQKLKKSPIYQRLIADNPHYELYLQTLYDMSNHDRSEEHTSELQSRFDLVCRLLLEKKKI